MVLVGHSTFFFLLSSHTECLGGIIVDVESAAASSEPRSSLGVDSSDTRRLPSCVESTACGSEHVEVHVHTVGAHFQQLCVK